jgi:hypothetical protein
MKLWLADMLHAISQECGSLPQRHTDKGLSSTSLVWCNPAGLPVARYWTQLRLLKKYSMVDFDYSYSQFLFYADGTLGQRTVMSNGRMSTECFSPSGEPISFEDFCTKDVI